MANKGPVNVACDEIGVENYVVSFKFYVYKKTRAGMVDFIKRCFRLLQADAAEHYGLDFLKKKQVDWMNSHCEKVDTSKNFPFLVPGNKTYRSKIGVVMMGELCDAKGQHILLEVLHRLGDKSRLFSVHFYGTGSNEYENNLKKLSMTYGLEVIFHGFVEDAASELYKYDVGVVCSKGEGFGLATLKYMCIGLCIIATDTGANRELITNESLGMIFCRDGVDMLAKFLERTIDEREAACIYGMNAKKYAEDHFTLDRQIKEIERIYIFYKIIIKWWD